MSITVRNERNNAHCDPLIIDVWNSKGVLMQQLNLPVNGGKDSFKDGNEPFIRLTFSTNGEVVGKEDILGCYMDTLVECKDYYVKEFNCTSSLAGTILTRHYSIELKLIEPCPESDLDEHIIIGFKHP